MKKEYNELQDTSHIKKKAKHTLILVPDNTDSETEERSDKIVSYAGKLINDGIIHNTTIIFGDQSKLLTDITKPHKSRFLETYFHYINIVNYVLDIQAFEGTENEETDIVDELHIIDASHLIVGNEILKSKLSSDIETLNDLLIDNGIQSCIYRSNSDNFIIINSVYSNVKAIMLEFNNILSYSRVIHICDVIARWCCSN